MARKKRTALFNKLKREIEKQGISVHELKNSPLREEKLKLIITHLIRMERQNMLYERLSINLIVDMGRRVIPGLDREEAREIIDRLCKKKADMYSTKAREIARNLEESGEVKRVLSLIKKSVKESE